MTEKLDQFIRALSTDLAPVRRIPPVRSVVTRALLCAGLAGLGLLAVYGLRPGLVPFDLPIPFLSILVGLTLVGFGGIAAALGGSVPGREGLARTGEVGMLLGLLVAGGVGFALFLHASALMPLGASWTWQGLRCLLRASALAVVPALIVAGFVQRAAPHRPLAALATAAGGALGLGTVAVHLSCPQDDAAHVLVFHALSPVVGAALVWLFLHAARRGRSGPRDLS